MRVLLDEWINRKFGRHLPGIDIKTVRQMRWNGIKNGALLTLADGNFDALVTVDKSIDSQQKIANFGIAVIILRARSNRLEGLLPFAQSVLDALPVAPKGETTWLMFP